LALNIETIGRAAATAASTAKLTVQAAGLALIEMGGRTAYLTCVDREGQRVAGAMGDRGRGDGDPDRAAASAAPSLTFPI